MKYDGKECDKVVIPTMCMYGIGAAIQPQLI